MVKRKSMNSRHPLYQFKVILNPKRFYVFGAKKANLLIFDDYVIFKKWRNPLKIPYTAINSLYLEEGKAFLKWDDEILSFGVASYISPSTFDASLTTQVLNLILEVKSEGAIPPEAQPELSLKKIAGDKRKLFIKVIIAGMAFAVIGTIFFDTLLSRPGLFAFGFICYMVIFATFIRHRGPTQRHNEKGVSYVATGKADRGIEEFKEALKISPNNLDVRLNLASTYFLKKDFLSAQVECQKILELNPSYEAAKKLLDKIEAHSRT